MSLKFKPKKSFDKTKRPSDDIHPALIAQIIDLGSHFKKDFTTGEIATWKDGNPIIMQEIYVTFEFPTQMFVYEEGEAPKPAWVSKRYSVSRNEKSALYELLKAANCLKSDLSELAGRVVMAEVGSTNTGNPKIVGVTAAKKKILVDDEVVNAESLVLSKGECIIYEVEDGQNSTYNSLPPFVKEMIDNQDSIESYKSAQTAKEESSTDNTEEMVEY
jgi:hypothetical protein